MEGGGPAVLVWWLCAVWRAGLRAVWGCGCARLGPSWAVWYQVPAAGAGALWCALVRFGARSGGGEAVLVGAAGTMGVEAALQVVATKALLAEVSDLCGDTRLRVSGVKLNLA